MAFLGPGNAVSQSTIINQPLEWEIVKVQKCNQEAKHNQKSFTLSAFPIQGDVIYICIVALLLDFHARLFVICHSCCQQTSRS